MSIKKKINLKIYLLALLIIIFSIISSIKPIMRIGTEIDSNFLNFVESIRTPFLNKLMLFFTFLGNEYLVIILSLITIILLRIYRKNNQIILLLTSIIGGEIFIWILKNLVQRERPPYLNALVIESTYSFPSGHAFISMTFYFLLIYMYYLESKSKKRKDLLFTLGIIFVLGMGFSRIYLGVHWPSDVLASYVLGIIWIIGLTRVFKGKEKNIKKEKSIEK